MKIITAPEVVKILWGQGFFKTPKKIGEIKDKFEDLECHQTDQNINSALQSAPFLTKKGSKGKYRYAQKYASKEVTLSEDVLSKALEMAMGKAFSIEIYDLKLNYGKSGTCTAFMLRKILEKLIYIVMAKNGLDSLLIADSATGKLIGLEAMIDKVSKQKIVGKHLLMPKTAEKVGGIKFLGDTAAHNPLTNVEMETIVPVMPYIITAYQELSSYL